MEIECGLQNKSQQLCYENVKLAKILANSLRHSRTKLEKGIVFFFISFATSSCNVTSDSNSREQDKEEEY